MDIRGIPNKNLREFQSLNATNVSGRDLKKLHIHSAHGKNVQQMGKPQLAEKLVRFPEVRKDLVASAIQKLASGEYLTKTAADATAAAILN